MSWGEGVMVMLNQLSALQYTCFVLVFALVAPPNTALAQTPERPPIAAPQTIDDIEGVPNFAEVIDRGKSGSGTDCNVTDNETFCSTTSYTFNGLGVSKLAAPYMVQIVTNEAYIPSETLRERFPGQNLWELRHVCGGALIDENWAITAAHCFDRSDEGELYDIRTDFKLLSEPSETPRKIERIIIHEDYEKEAADFDIALIKLKPAPQNTGDMPVFGQTQSLESRPAFNDRAYFADEDRLFLSTGLEARLWNLKSNMQILKLTGFNYHIRSENHSAFIFPNKVEIYDLLNGRMLRRFELSDVNGVKFLDSNKAILLSYRNSQTNENETTLWSISSGQLTANVSGGFFTTDTIWLNRNALILKAHNDDYFHWRPDRREGALLNLGRLDGVVYDEGLKHFAGLDQFGITFFDLNTGLDIGRVDIQQRYQPSFSNPRPQYNKIIGHSKNGKYVTLRNEGPWVLTWDVKTGELISTIKLDDVDMRQKLDDANGRILFWSNSEVQIWDVVSGNQIFSQSGTHSTYPAYIGFFDRGKKLLLSEYAGRTIIFDVKTGDKIRQFDHSLPITSASLDKKLEVLTVWNDYGSAELWSLNSEEPLLRGYVGGHILNAWAANRAARMFTLRENGELVEWDVRSKKKIMRLFPISAEPKLELNSQGISEPKGYPQKLEFGCDTCDVDREYWVQTSGWGKTRPVRRYEASSILRTVALRPLSHERCAEQGGWSEGLLNDKVFCANATERKTCKGDSGSPVINHNNQLVGIVSWGSGHCGSDNKPSVYTRVKAYSGWIEEQMID